jgi:hypothetical protein
MIVLRVDARRGPNAAFYRVGFNLAGIAVADFGAQGLALVVLQVRGRGKRRRDRAGRKLVRLEGRS